MESLNKVRDGIGLATAGASMVHGRCRKVLADHMLGLLDEVVEIPPCKEAWTRVVSTIPHQHQPFGFHGWDPQTATDCKVAKVYITLVVGAPWLFLVCCFLIVGS